MRPDSTTNPICQFIQKDEPDIAVASGGDDSRYKQLHVKLRRLQLPYSVTASSGNTWICSQSSADIQPFISVPTRQRNEHVLVIPQGCILAYGQTLEQHHGLESCSSIRTLGTACRHVHAYLQSLLPFSALHVETTLEIAMATSTVNVGFKT